MNASKSLIGVNNMPQPDHRPETLLKRVLHGALPKSTFALKGDIVPTASAAVSKAAQIAAAHEALCPAAARWTGKIETSSGRTDTASH
jgi:hypothetical protein